MDAYRRYAPALLRKCERLLSSRQDSEDIVQGLFVDMLKAGRAEGLELPYLYRAVTNRCLNHLKYGANRRRLLQEHDIALRGAARTRCDDRVIGLQLLTNLVQRLDPKCQEVLVYRYFDDMTLPEIAELVKTSTKTVSKRLAKVRTAVQRLVAEDNDE